MYEPGLDRHEWEGEMQALEADIVANRSMVDADITPAGEPDT